MQKDDVIYRQMAIDAICKACSLTEDYHKCDGYPEESTWCEELVALRALPSAQPQQKKGRWLPDNNCYYETRYMCSECKLPFHVDTIMMKPSWRFCPNCGARMDGENE